MLFTPCSDAIHPQVDGFLGLNASLRGARLASGLSAPSSRVAGTLGSMGVMGATNTRGPANTVLTVFTAHSLFSLFGCDQHIGKILQNETSIGA